ncbi:MAG TPA: hypothetical protein VI479_23420, partial [Blastocatellia bacterium]
MPDFAPAFCISIGRINYGFAFNAVSPLLAGFFQIGELDGLTAIWAEYFHSQLWLTEHLPGPVSYSTLA